MKQTFYVLTNNSRSEGTVYIGGEYRTIYPDDRITTDKCPTNKTSNIIVSMYLKEMDEVIQNKKRRQPVN